MRVAATVVAVMQVLKPTSAKRSLLLVALLLLPGILSLSPTLPAQVPGAACVPQIDSISVTPSEWLDVGQAYTIRVRLSNTATPPAPPPTPPTVRVAITVDYRDVAADDSSTQVTSPPSEVTASFTVPAGTGNGRSTIRVQLSETGTPPSCVVIPEGQPNSNAVKLWGIVTGEKPDLESLGWAKLVEHNSVTAASPNPAAHNDTVEFDNANLFTRYRDSDPADQSSTACKEEDPAERPSNLHFVLRVQNNGADFAAPVQGGGPMSVRISLADNGQTLASNITSFSALAGATSDVLFPYVYNLVNKSGVRNISITIDPLGELPETNNNNNVFNSAGSSQSFVIKAPDLTGAISMATPGSDQVSRVTWSIRNIGTERAGASPTGNVLCYSRNGNDFVVGAYLDVVDPAHFERDVERTLEDGDAATLDEFLSRPLKAGPHKMLLVLDTGNNITDLNATNDIVESNEIVIADTRAPVLSGITSPATARVGQRVNITGRVNDDADFRVTGTNAVFVDITFPAPNSTTISYQVVNPVNVQSGVLAGNNTDLYEFYWNAPYDLEGTYTFRVRAVDAANKSTVFPALADAPLSFILSSFSKGVENVKVWLCKGQNAVPDDNPTTPEDPTPLDCTVGNNTNHYTYIPTQTTPTPAGGAPVQEGNVMNVTFRIPPDATGLPNEHNNSARKWVQVTDPDSHDLPEPRTLGFFAVEPVCFTTADQAVEAECNDTVDPATNQPLTAATCTGAAPTQQFCYNYTFNFRAGVNYPVRRSVLTTPSCEAATTNTTLHFLKPGPYNLTLWVYDQACSGRANGLPNTPLYSLQLWAAPATNVTQIDRPSAPVTAGNNATIRANVTSATNAQPAVKRAQVNVYWPGNRTLLGAFNMTARTPFNATSGNGTYEAVLDTGFGRRMDVAGNYEAVIAMMDANRTWSFAASNGEVCTPTIRACDEPRFVITVADRQAPSVTNVVTRAPGGTSTTSFQEGTPLVVQANVADDTRLRVEAVVQNATTFAEVARVNMTRTASLYHTDELPTGNGTSLPVGSYRVLVVATDSASPTPNVVQSAPVTISVAGNLPPAFLRLSPPPDGFGRPGGVVSVEIVDAREGVASGTIAVRAGATNGTLDTVTSVIKNESDPVAGQSTFRTVRASFVLPSGFSHGARVAVNVSASDGTAGTPLTGSVEWTFTVDALPPRTTMACSRAHPRACGETGVQAVRGDTVFFLNATDPDPENRARAGVARIEVTAEAGGAVVLTRSAEAANATFTLGEALAEDGVVKVQFRAVDAAGNSEPQRSFDFQLDQRGPQAQNVLVAATSTGWNVSATITDLFPNDVRSARILHRTEVTGYQTVEMRQLPDTRFWYGDIPGSRRGTRVCYYLEAVDFLGNVATNGTAESPSCFAGENHPPALTVLSPQEGEDVGASMTVRWQTSDIDGDPVTVAVGYRRQGENQLLPVPLSSEDQGRRTVLVDTTQLVAGDYVLRVDASDNQAFNNRTTRTLNFTVGGGSGANRPVFSSPTIGLGEPVTVRVEIGRAVSDIEARLLRGGQVVDRQPMEQNPPGSRFYEATFRISDPGVYEVEVVGEYEDGTPFTIRGASAVTVQAGLPGFLDALVMVVLAAAVVALGVVGLKRRGLM